MYSADFTGSDRKHQAARRFVSPPDEAKLDLQRHIRKNLELSFKD